MKGTTIQVLEESAAVLDGAISLQDELFAEVLAIEARMKPVQAAGSPISQLHSIPSPRIPVSRPPLYWAIALSFGVGAIVAFAIGLVAAGRN